MIEYCLSNVEPDARARLGDRGAREYACLEHCGRCYRESFLVVDGEFVAGESHAALLQEVDG